MKKTYSNKFFVVFIGVISILYIMIFFSSTTISNAHAQKKTADIGVEKIKALLLEQDIWVGEWDCKDKAWSVGIVNDFVFEDRGNKIIVKIDSPFDEISCERDIKINSDGFKMSGCGIGITRLIYDPDDNIYPFKTKGTNQECELKVRHYNPEIDFR